MAQIMNKLHEWSSGGFCHDCGCLYVGFERIDPCPGKKETIMITDESGCTSGFETTPSPQELSEAYDFLGENNRLRLELAATIREGISGVADAKETAADDQSKMESEPFAYAHPLGAIWRLDNYPAGMDFTKDGWFPLYRQTPSPQTNLRLPEGWALVPIKPSREMTKAGEHWSPLPEQVWQDMIDAAPVSEVENGQA